MMNQKLTDALSHQVNNEYFSAYLYLSMSAHCDRLGFKGFSNWLYVQAQEEMVHGIHMYQYILERGALPTFSTIAAPEGKYDTFRNMFERVLKHEQSVTSGINKIASLAMSEGDHATYNFILWYVNEQIEEESSAELLLQKFTLIGDNAGLLYALDAELATRMFTDPFAGAKQP